jgi:hypothetical protein
MKKTISLLLAFLMVLSLAACGGEKKDETGVSNGETESDAQASADASTAEEPPAPEAKESAAEEEEPQVFEMGNTVTTDWVAFTLNDLTYTDYWGPNGDKNKSISAGNVCANAFYTVENVGKKAFNSANAAWLVLDYDNGYNYPEQDTYHKSLQGGNSYVGTWDDILPLTNTVEQVTYFEIPEAIKEDTEHTLHINVTLKYEDGTEETFIYAIR